MGVNYNVQKDDILEKIHKGMDRKEIAEEFGCSINTVSNYLKKYDIKLKKRSLKEIFTKEYLHESYFINFLTQKDLSNLHSCSMLSIYRYTTHHNILYKKSIYADHKLEDKKWLYDQYKNLNRSMDSIANELNVDYCKVRNALIDHGITIKTRYEEKVWMVNIPIIELSSGKTSKEIAELYDASEEYVRNLQIKNNIDRLGCVNTSLIEKKIRDILDNSCISYVCNTKKIITPYEIDIYIESKKIAIEVNGTYFHSEKFVDKKYHEMKRLRCEENGIRLIQFFEDDINNPQKFKIIESIIKNSIGISESNRIYARKCDIVADISIDDRRIFLNTHHIQGFAKSTTHIGLMHQGNLVALMLFDGNILSRYATSDSVIGGFSKCLKNSNMDYVKTYVDYTTFTGNMYEKCGFEYKRYISPDYSYVYKNKRHHKFNFRKDRFMNDPSLKFEENKTEKSLALLNNIYRIYDAGKGVYVWQNHHQDKD